MDDLGLHFYGSIPVNEVGPIMLTSSGYMSDEDDELDEDGNYGYYPVSTIQPP